MALVMFNGDVAGTGFDPTIIAPLFESTKSYDANTLVFFEMRLYKFVAAKPIGPWDPNKAVLTTISDIYKEIKEG